jgi:hypothetical protein
VITANTRITVTRMQNLLKDRCLAVHTDSVMCLDPLTPEQATGALGGFAHEVSGKGIIISCGMYEISDKTKFKGFRLRRGASWRRILKNYPGRRRIRFTQLHVESWIEAMSKNHLRDRINVFENVPKVVDLNADDKRAWAREVKTDDLLDGLEQSSHIVVMEREKPRSWLTQNI